MPLKNSRRNFDFSYNMIRIYSVAIGILLCLPLNGCKLKVNSAQKSDDASNLSESAKNLPVLSYSGSTGTQGIIGQAMTITPTALSAGDSNATISKCAIQAGSPNSANFPTTLSVNASTCVISGTPSGGLGSTLFTLEVTNSLGKSSTATVLLSVAGAADHLVIVSGNSQNIAAGSALTNFKVRVVDRYETPYSGGISLGIIRMLGIDSTPSSSVSVTTDSDGYATFSAKLGFSPASWQIIPMGSTLPDLAASGGTSLKFTATPSTLGNGTFQNQVTTATGTSPRGVAVSDLNGDGKLDLVVANNGSSNVGVFLGNGNGTFQAQVTYAVGAGPGGINIADFTGDGILDIGTANMSGTTYSVLPGVGNGTFQAQVTTTIASSNYFGAAIGDFNQDGKLDLALPNSTNLAVHFGNGNGTFQAATTYTTGSTPRGHTVGDFNGDGKLDLAIANYSSSNIGIFINNGNGTFQNQVAYAVGSSPAGMVTGDFNNDGKLDIAVNNYSSGNIGVLLGNGNGTFQNQTTYTAGTSPYGPICLGDFNGDGKLDIAVGNSGSNNLSVFIGNGNGTFQNQVTYSTGSNPYAGIVTGDFNGDGKADLVATNFGANSFSLYIGN